MKRVTSLRGAPPHVKKWWSRTGVECALFRLVELGATWDEAHDRLYNARLRWWDRGRKGRDPLDRLARLVSHVRLMEDAASGRYKTTFSLPKGVPHVHIDYRNGWFAGPFPLSNRFPQLVERCHGQ